ncbi:ABC transporter substrate-binding protein [Leptospira yanagawae]|uniref:ABC transporter substrate-binding protein n=1 Tax=Leptospira yanagawae TaxID=293069 RepID=UPI001AEFA9CD|nr:ABC transporter substrate-binding protein [Leptospira yanagawae]
MEIETKQIRKIPSWTKILIPFLFFAQSSFANESVGLYLKWKHQFQFAGYYTALEKGYYKEVGLDVTIHESKNGLEGLHQFVSEKEARYGVGTNEVLLQWHAGKPIVVIAVIFQHSPTVLFTKKIQTNQSIQDLLGKKIMLSPHVYEILAYLKKEKFNSNNFKELPHSFRFLDLVEGKVAALDGYSTTQTYEFQKIGFPVMVFSPRTSGIDFYGDNLFTSQLEIQTNPNRVKRFREASLRGWNYAMKNKSEIVDLIYQKYSNDITKEQLLFEADEMESLIQPNLVEIGYMYEGRWKHISDVYADFGMLPKNLNLNGFLYYPNPKPDYGLLVSIFVSVFGFLLVVWVLQRYRWNVQYSENLRREVLHRTDELKVSNDNLHSTNKILELKLSELREAQSKLLTSEKLATIGNVTAGMAHELNNPLGAIVSTNSGIADFFHKELNSIIHQLVLFSKEDRERFFLLIKGYTNIQIDLLSGKKEREFKKDLKMKMVSILNKQEDLIEEDFLDLLIDSLAYTLEEKLNWILESSNAAKILELGSKIANVYRSNSIISLASEKSTQVVKTLKNYLLTDDASHKEERNIDIVQGIETILTLYNYQTNNRVKFIKEFRSHRKGKGNQDLFQLVWVNLLNNALYAIGNQGTIEIESKDDGPWIVVSFIDGGMGIPEELKDRIFDPFFTTKKEGEGLGLGLGICRKVMEKMGGHIQFESRAGQTRFDVYVPADEGSPSPGS